MTLIIGQRKNGNSKQDFLTITNVCNISDTFFPHEYLLEQTSQKGIHQYGLWGFVSTPEVL